MTDDLNEIKAKRKKELMDKIKQQGAQQEAVERQKQQLNAIKQQAIKKLTTKKARERIGRIRAADPEKAEKIELMIIKLYQAGRIQGKINDEKLKEILKKIKSQKKETKITRK